MSKKRYALIIRGKYKVHWVHFVYHKYEKRTVFLNCIREHKKESNHTIEILRSDNGK